MNTEKIIELLEKGDAQKRKEAFVTEYFFQHQIVSKLLSREGDFTFGWIYVNEFDNGKLTRYWYKVQSFENYDNRQKQIDRSVIQKIKNNSPARNYFYFIRFRFDYQNGIKLKLAVYVPDFDASKYKKIDHKSILNTGSIINAFTINQEKEIKHEDRTISEWFKDVPNSYLELLLAQRLIMNHGFGDSRWPVDVDAIQYVENENRLRFIEFKRKNPCTSYLLNSTHLRRKSIFNDIQTEIKKAKELTITGTNIVHQSLLKNGYVRDDAVNYYGLDMSHYKNFQYVDSMQASYIYMVWHVGEDRPKLADLFENIDIPLNEIKLYSITLNQSDFVGFIYTEGADSGSYTNANRLQVTINAPEDRKGVVNPNSRFTRVDTQLLVTKKQIKV